MSEITIRAISLTEARPLRVTVLRPNLPVESTIYPLDGDPDTRHFGAFLDGDLVGITTVCREAPPGEENPHAWRMRGVAVAPQARRKGCARQLAQACLDYVAARGGTCLWANGRTAVLPFYRSVGFDTRGDEFVTETGPHFLVWRKV